ncbi:MAG TPA: hypothetical protein VHO03_19150 [Ignavibacteriales bacterium]|nr:hypothetical protein [Ignavibacteriales bacterium]
MKTQQEESVKNGKSTDIGFYMLAGLLGVSFLLIIGYIVYALFF